LEKGLGEPRRTIGVAKSRSADVAEHGEVAGLNRVVEGKKRAAQQENDLLRVPA
jgi:hypothetical protein